MTLTPEQFIAIIPVDVIGILKKTASTSVSKAVSLPQYLVTLAEVQHILLSKFMQQQLRKALKLDRIPPGYPECFEPTSLK